MAILEANYIQLPVTVTFITNTAKDVTITIDQNIEHIQLEKRISVIVIKFAFIECYLVINVISA